MQVTQKTAKTKMPAYKLLFPALILIAAFYGYPLIYGIKLAFQHYVLVEPDNIHFCGFENFINIFKDPNIPRIFWNSFIWVVVTVSLQFILGFILALILNKSFRGKGIYQAIIFLPWAISGFLIGIMFRWMFSEHNGVINFIFVKLGILHTAVPFLALPATAIFTCITAMVWYGVPFFGIMILSALQSVPDEVYESADMDGANQMTQLFKITIPYIKSTIIITLLLRVIWVFNSADIIYIMTNGGPANSSHNLPSYIFSQVFTITDFGQASALGVIMITLLIVYTLIFLKVAKYNEAGDF
jgi:multiple sugar transport system permease protein